MFRLIGFIIGVVATIVVLAAVVDGPTRERAGALAIDLTTTVFDAVEGLGTEREAGDAGRDEALRSARSTSGDTTESATSEDMPAPVPPASENNVTGAGEPTAAEETIASPAERITELAPSPEWRDRAAPETVTTQSDTADSSAEVLNWEPVWWAFHSELSAKGFADYLIHLTGHEYRVRRTSPWAYQVELAYVDEEQRDAVLREIRGKTGLGLGEARR